MKAVFLKWKTAFCFYEDKNYLGIHHSCTHLKILFGVIKKASTRFISINQLC